MKVNRKSAGSQSGFTMIEVTLVMLVGTILLSIFGTSLLNLMREAKIRQTEIRINEINESLRRFASYNNRLPCPASRTLRPEAGSGGTNAATNYGVEYTSCTSLVTSSALTTTSNVTIGMVPTRTLGLPDEYGYDAWGSRFIYAATPSMTVASSYNPASASIEIDGAGTANAAFVLVSVGPDREGGYSVDGVESAPCNATPGIDQENCDEDHEFKNGMQSMGRNADYYDDYIRYQSLAIGDEFEIPVGAVMAFRLNSCPTGWDEMPAVAGRVIVGRGTYNQTVAPDPSPVNPGFVEEDYELAEQGGSYTRRASTAGSTEYNNMPPFIVYRYCVKN